MIKTAWTKLLTVSQIKQLVLTISEISAKTKSGKLISRGGPNKKEKVRQKIKKLISRGGLLFGTEEYMKKWIARSILWKPDQLYQNEIVIVMFFLYESLT